MEIKHKISNGWVYYSEYGITIKPHLYWNTFVIPWTEIDFVCPFPTVFFENNEWFKYSTGLTKLEFVKTNLMEANAILKKEIDYFQIYIVVKDHKKISYGKNIFEKFIGLYFFPILFRLINTEKKHAFQSSYFYYAVNKKTLNVPLRILLNFIQQKSKYGQLGIE